jgi:hypothetical protein
VPGAVLVIAGFVTGSAGEILRLASDQVWRPLAGSAIVLISGGMVCGVALLAAAGWWHGEGRRRARSLQRGVLNPPSMPVVAPVVAPVAGQGGPVPAPGHPLSLNQHGVPGPPAGYRAPPATVPAAGPGGAEQKLVELKDLYRTAEAMGDAALGESWEELRYRQEELIRGYFEAARLNGSPEAGQQGTRRLLPRVPGRRPRAT